MCGVLYCTYFSALLVSFDCFCTCNKYNLCPCTDHHQSDIVPTVVVIVPTAKHMSKSDQNRAQKSEQSRAEKSRVDAERSGEERRNT